MYNIKKKKKFISSNNKTLDNKLKTGYSVVIKSVMLCYVMLLNNLFLFIYK